ncbi:MAG: hypothetical protein GY869_05620, partial [Planctomycetes bacterium]|nr:hypothetical protein [Planctomycetota bacterium]
MITIIRQVDGGYGNKRVVAGGFLDGNGLVIAEACCAMAVTQDVVTENIGIIWISRRGQVKLIA